MSVPQNYCHQRFCPCSEPYPSPTSARDTLIPAGRSGPGFYEITVCFLPWSWYTGDVVCVLREWSFCSLQYCEFPVIKPCLLSSKQVCSEGSSWYQTSRLGSLTWGSELPLLWENLSNVIIFPLVSCPSSGAGILILLHLCLSYPLVASLSLDVGYLFWYIPVLLLFFVCFACFLVDDCSSFSCNFDFFVRSELMYNIIPPICLHDG